MLSAKNLLIASPCDQETFPSGWVKIQGYLFTNRPSAAKKIQISADGGLTWQPVQLVQTPFLWAWGYWETCLYLPEGCHILMARATHSWVRMQAFQASWDQICVYCV